MITLARAKTWLTVSMRGIPGVTSLFAVVVGLMVLLCWLIAPTAFITRLPLLAEISPNTALSLALLGFSMRMSRLESVSRWAYTVSKGFRAAVGLLALLSLVEMWLGWKLNVDRLLFNAVRELIPPKYLAMTPATALGFYFLSGTLMLLSARRLLRLCQLLGSAALLLTLTALVGHLFNSRSPIMPLPTAIMLLALSVGFLTKTQHGFMAVVTSDTAGGSVARRLLPAAILIPIALGWLRLLGERAGWFSADLGLIFHVVTSMCLFGLVVFWNAIRLLGHSRTGELSHEIRSEYEHSLKEVCGSVSDAVYMHDLYGNIAYMNEAARRLLGCVGRESQSSNIYTILGREAGDILQRTVAQQLLRSGSGTCQLPTRPSAETVEPAWLKAKTVLLPERCGPHRFVGIIEKSHAQVSQNDQPDTASGTGFCQPAAEPVCSPL